MNSCNKPPTHIINEKCEKGKMELLHIFLFFLYEELTALICYLHMLFSLQVSASSGVKI